MGGSTSCGGPQYVLVRFLRGFPRSEASKFCRMIWLGRKAMGAKSLHEAYLQCSWGAILRSRHSPGRFVLRRSQEIRVGIVVPAVTVHDCGLAGVC